MSPTRHAFPQVNAHIHVTRRPVSCGTPVSVTYGFTGSESDLVLRGAVLAGGLDPRKSRLLLWALLALGRGQEEVHAEIARRGRTGSPTPS